MDRDKLVDLILFARGENRGDHVHVQKAESMLEQFQAKSGPSIPTQPAEPVPTPKPVEPAPKPPVETPAPVEKSELFKAPQQVDQYVSQDEKLNIIASQPQSVWLNGEDVWGKVRDMCQRAKQLGQTPVFTIYAIPGRDNGNYSAGGLNSVQEYYGYIGAVADALADYKAIVILEPDALGLGRDLSDATKRNERHDMLHGAVKALKAKPNVKVFIDASGWVGAAEQAKLLQRVNIETADGFATNVSGYKAQADTVRYAKDVLKELTNLGITLKKAVIDTSRNGNGEWQTNEKDPWCNPPGRKLGLKPTLATGDPDLYAFLWVKNPGESDGNLRGPNAGQFDKALALALINN